MTSTRGIHGTSQWQLPTHLFCVLVIVTLALVDVSTELGHGLQPVLVVERSAADGSLNVWVVQRLFELGAGQAL